MEIRDRYLHIVLVILGVKKLKGLFHDVIAQCFHIIAQSYRMVAQSFV